MNLLPAEPEFEALLDYLKHNQKCDLTGYKRSTLMRRFQQRMQSLKIDSYSSYLAYLQTHSDEYLVLLDYVLINVTSFFRDREAWDYLASEIVPKIIASKQPDEPIRVWSAGCASGQEAYSLAMLLVEVLGIEEFAERVKIYATDLDEEAINYARHATYKTKEVADLSPEQLEKYFEFSNGNYTFRKDLRRSVIFGRNNLIQDAPIFFGADTTGSQPWEPKNYDGKYEGPMPLRRGLAKSKNMISIRVLNSIGPRYAQNWATRFGFDADKHPAYLTMALGAGSVTPIQLATAYSVFANGGYRVQPSLITRITDVNGRVLAQTRPRALDESMRAIEPRNAFLMTSLLQEVTRSGTAARAQATLKRSDIYGKTGTTNDSMDAWFAGYNPTLTAVVWIGYDTPRKLGDKETGGGLALPVWIDYMAYALRSTPITEPSVPEGIVHIGGEWYFEEFTRGAGGTAPAVASEEKPAAERPAPAQPADERKGSGGLLDLFRKTD